MGLVADRVSRDSCASDLLIDRRFPHLAFVFPSFCGVFPQKWGHRARCGRAPGECPVLFKQALTAFAWDDPGPRGLVVGRPGAPPAQAISGWIGEGASQLQRFDAPTCGVAYWAHPTPPSAVPPMSTERSHLQRCMEPDGGRMEPEACCISLEAEVPEVLFEGMREFLDNHPHWDQYRLISSALASFLFQNGCSDQGVTQQYLNGLFLRR